jgi:hypothetical protein
VLSKIEIDVNTQGHKQCEINDDVGGKLSLMVVTCYKNDKQLHGKLHVQEMTN